MTSRWRQSKWGEEISLEYGKAIRGYQDATAPFRVFGTNGPVGWTETPLAPGPGVILGRKGAYRGVHFSPDPFFVIDTAYFVKPRSKDLEMRWLYYAIIYYKLGEIDDGSPIPSTTRAAVYVRDVEIPPLPEQRAIASILGALDDKIDLNRCMNKTLEAMARALFRDWFVDFGPTRAKMEGREPYLTAALWALFPDRLEAEKKPEGWSLGALSDVAESPSRGVNPSDVAEETPYIGLEHMPRRSIALSEWEGAGKVSSNKSAFKKGEFLFGKLRPYFHKVGVAPLDGICSTDIVVVRPRIPEWGAFTLACLSSDEFVAYTDQTSTGTKMPRTSWNTMGRYEVCLPSESVAVAFQEIVQSMLDRVSANIHESRTLAQTRDLLLPKLMSGEIRVREAERMVEEVV
jgi:type I restriction enzyme, S subunit